MPIELTPGSINRTVLCMVDRAAYFGGLILEAAPELTHPTDLHEPVRLALEVTEGFDSVGDPLFKVSVRRLPEQ